MTENGVACWGNIAFATGCQPNYVWTGFRYNMS